MGGAAKSSPHRRPTVLRVWAPPQALLVAGAPPSAPNREGLTPLLAAAAAGSLPALALLLMVGASPHEADTEGNNALHHAACNGHVTAVDALMAAGVDAGARNAAQLTPFMVAAASGQQQAAAVLEGAIGSAGSGPLPGARSPGGAGGPLPGYQPGYPQPLPPRPPQPLPLQPLPLSPAHAAHAAALEALLEAAGLGDLAALAAELARGAVGLNEGDSDGDTALHWVSVPSRRIVACPALADAEGRRVHMLGPTPAACGGGRVALVQET